jgi:hypothetical protein
MFLLLPNPTHALLTLFTTSCLCRDFAAQCSTQFAPLISWYANWAAQRKDQYTRAEAWWDGAERMRLALDGARGKKPVATSGAAAGQKAGGSDSGEDWRDGSYDFNTGCPICQQEQQQKNAEVGMRSAKGGLANGAAASKSSSSHVNGCGSVSSDAACSVADLASPAVPYSDPFMWRRLLWQLLGKLSPESQAFYAQYLAVCPHCPSYV